MRCLGTADNAAAERMCSISGYNRNLQTVTKQLQGSRAPHARQGKTS